MTSTSVIPTANSAAAITTAKQASPPTTKTAPRRAADIGVGRNRVMPCVLPRHAVDGVPDYGNAVTGLRLGGRRRNCRRSAAVDRSRVIADRGQQPPDRPLLRLGCAKLLVDRRQLAVRLLELRRHVAVQ